MSKQIPDGTKLSALYSRLNAVVLKNEADEDGLIEALQRKKVVADKRDALRVANDLYDRLMTGLRNSNDHDTKYNDLLASMQDIQILFEYDLLDDCYERVQEAKKLAKELDKPGLLLELFWLEKRLATSANERNTLQHFEDLIKEEKRYLNSTNRLASLVNLYGRFSLEQRRGASVDAFLEEIEALETRPDDSFHTRLFYHQMKADALKIKAEKLHEKSNYEKAFVHQEQAIALFDGSKHMVTENKAAYLNNLDRFLTLCLHMNRLEYFKKYQGWLDQNRESLVFFKNICHLYIFRFITTGEFDQGIAFIEKSPSVDSGIALYRDNIPEARLFVIYYACAQTYFLAERFDDAAYWLRKIIDVPDRSVRIDIRCLARIFDLIVKFETKWKPAKGSKEDPVQALAQYLRETELWDDFLRNFVKAMEVLFDQREPARLLAFYKNGQVLLNGHERDSPFGLILWWMESRATDKKMADLKSKYLPA